MAIVTGQPQAAPPGRYFKYRRLNRRSPRNAAGQPNYNRRLEWAMYTDQTNTQQHVKSQDDYTCTAADFPTLPAPAAGQTMAQTILHRPGVTNCVMRVRPAAHVCDATCTPPNFAADNTKDIYDNIDLCQTDNMGIGVFATAPIPAQSLIGLYTGNLMDRANMFQGQEKYGMTLGKKDDVNDAKIDVVVDSMAQGGWTRFVNHSCRPNCKIMSGFNCGTSKVLYFRTTRNIAAGQQLFLNYGKEYFRVAGIGSAIEGAGCLCGKRGCHSKKPAPRSARGKGKRKVTLRGG